MSGHRAAASEQEGGGGYQHADIGLCALVVITRPARRWGTGNPQHDQLMERALDQASMGVACPSPWPWTAHVSLRPGNTGSQGQGKLDNATAADPIPHGRVLSPEVSVSGVRATASSKNGRR
jgi:hypothetical protein